MIEVEAIEVAMVAGASFFTYVVTSYVRACVIACWAYVKSPECRNKYPELFGDDKK